MKEKLVTWSTDQLRKEAESLGVSFGDFTTRAELIDLIAEAVNERSKDAKKVVAGAGGEDPVSRAGSKEKGSGKAQGEPADAGKQGVESVGNVLPSKTQRCWFRVSAGSSELEKSDVFAAINGASVLVKRNHWVQMPVKYLPVFENAITTEVHIDREGKTLIRDVPRFNYEVRSLSEGKPKESSVPRGF